MVIPLRGSIRRCTFRASMPGLLLLLALAIVDCQLIGAEAAKPPRSPNFVVLLADDLGYGDLSCYGNESIHTPNLDRLAAEGARFTHFLSPAPVCSPSRSGLMTGRYPVRAGMVSSVQNFRTINSPAIAGGLPRSAQTFAEYLKEHAYDTGMFGKWHLGIHEGTNGTQDYNLIPSRRGFDTFYGMPVTNVQTCDPNRTVYVQSSLFVYFLSRTSHIWYSLAAVIVLARVLGLVGNRSTFLLALLLSVIVYGAYFYTANYFLLSRSACILMRNDRIVQQPVRLQNLTRNLAREATQWIGQHKDKPFLLYLPFVKVHTALFTTREFEGHSRAGSFGDNVEEMDWAVGQVMDALKQHGLDENTLVFFSSDNGPFLERGHEAGTSGVFPATDGSLHRLRGGKAQNWEGGIRVPGIVRWKGRIAAGQVIHQASTLMDVFPTIVDLIQSAEGPVATEPMLRHDGRSLMPLLTGKLPADELLHDVLFHYCGDVISAARVGHIKVHFSTPVWEDDSQSCPSATICSCAGSAVVQHDPPLVFDLRKDPSESTPLNPADHAPILATIHKALREHRQSIQPVPNQLERFARPWLFPCCNEQCECDLEPQDQA